MQVTGSNLSKEHQAIYDALDAHLKYHISLILNYAERNPISELHEKHLGDPVFEKFGLTHISFAQKRWAAGFANSCATNLGRFTDKAAKDILIHAFGVPKATILKRVEIQSNNKIEVEETDGVIMLSDIPKQHHDRLNKVIADLRPRTRDPKRNYSGVGFELRGRYGKNDDTLIQKDEHMAHALEEINAIPVLATFSTANALSAVRRLHRSWVFVSGAATIKLIEDLTDFNLMDYLDDRNFLLKPVVDLVGEEPRKIDETVHQLSESIEKLD